MSNKMDETFRLKKKFNKHNPQEESTKAVYGEPKAKEYDPTDFKI